MPRRIPIKVTTLESEESRKQIQKVVIPQGKENLQRKRYVCITEKPRMKVATFIISSIIEHSLKIDFEYSSQRRERALHPMPMVI